MDIPEFLKTAFGDTPEKIFAAKSEGRQDRPQLPSKSPEHIKLEPKECQELCEKAGVEYKEGFEDRVIRYVFSDESVDRMGDIIRQSGWDLKNFRKNPVILGFHLHFKPPVGNALKVAVLNKQLIGDVLFADEEISLEAEQAFKLAKAKFMRAGSVGFLPKEIKIPADDGEREKLGLGKWGVEFKKQELLEYSLVSVPANPNAVQETLRKGLLSLEDFKGWISEEDFDRLAIGVNGRKSVTISVPYKKYPLDEKDAKWNGPEETASAGAEDLKIMSAWIDPENGCKLPHHRADGHKTVWHGVTAAMGALLGARGGVKIPKADWKSVYDHLAKHYLDFDEEPPEFKYIESAQEVMEKYPDLFTEDKSQDFGFIREMLREELDTKAGAVLSKKNKQALESAAESIRSVLDASTSGSEEDSVDLPEGMFEDDFKFSMDADEEEELDFDWSDSDLNSVLSISDD